MAAPTIVQWKIGQDVLGGDYSVVLDAAPTEGNTLIALCWHNAFGSTWVPTLSGTWTQDAAGNGYDASQYGGPGADARLVAFSRSVGAAESATTSVTVFGASYTQTMIIEVAGAVAEVVTTDALTLTSSTNHDMSAAVTVPSLMLVAWGMQRTTYAPADSVASDVGVTELVDAATLFGAPHCWVAHRSLDTPGTLTVGGTPNANPNLDRWGVFSVAYVFTGTAPATEPKVTFTIGAVEFTGLLSKEIRVELNGPGEGHFTISRGDAQATAANLARGNIVKVTIPEIHSGVLFEFILEEGDFDLLDEDEEGGEELRFGGPGTLSILRRAIVWSEEFLDGLGYPKPNKGFWVFDASATEGHIINKLVREAQAAGRPQDPIPMVTKTFDATDDSNGVAWSANEFEGRWKVPIGSSLYDQILRLVQVGLLHVEMAPGFELNLYRSRGVNRTSGTFAANKVRFVAGVNIAGGLDRGMAGRDFASHALVKYEAGYTDTAKSGTFPYVQEIFFDAGDTDHANTARRAARGEMGWRETTQESLLLEHIVPWPGDPTDDATGLYLPGPTWSDNGKYWVGDTVTVHTGTGDHEYNNATHRVYAITLREDETGYLAPPILELNAPWLSADASSGGLSATPIAGSVTGSGGGGGGTVKVDLTAYQQTAEKDQADGYAGLDDSRRLSGTALSGHTWKRAVRCATTGPITIATDLNVGDTIDGVTLAAGGRVLVKDQTAPAENGIYIVDASPYRAVDFDEGDEVQGAVAYVIQGTANGGTAWAISNTAQPVIGTDAITFAAFGAGGGTAATTVEDETTWGITPAVGTDTEYARQDHTHGSPALLDLDDLGNVNAPTPSDDDVLAWDSGTSTWVPVAPGTPSIDWGEDADISTLDYDDVADAGVLDEAARADHVHGMPSAGGGGGGVSTPVKVQAIGSIGANTTNPTITMPATPTAGNSIILGLDLVGRAATGVSSTNTTWTRVFGTATSSGGSRYEVWVGVVGASAGTVITVSTGSSNFASLVAMEITDSLTPTAGASVSANYAFTAGLPGMLNGVTAGQLVAGIIGADNTTNPINLVVNVPHVWYSQRNSGTGVAVFACYAPTAGTVDPFFSGAASTAAYVLFGAIT